MIIKLKSFLAAKPCFLMDLVVICNENNEQVAFRALLI